MEKPVEYWVALATGALIVYERQRCKPMVSRVLIAAISAGIGYALAPDVAEFTGRSEIIAIMLLTAFGYLIVDVATALIADREFLKDLIRARLGSGKNE